MHQLVSVRTDSIARGIGFMLVGFAGLVVSAAHTGRSVGSSVIGFLVTAAVFCVLQLLFVRGDSAETLANKAASPPPEDRRESLARTIARCSLDLAVFVAALGLLAVLLGSDSGFVMCGIAAGGGTSLLFHARAVGGWEASRGEHLLRPGTFGFRSITVHPIYREPARTPDARPTA